MNLIRKILVGVDLSRSQPLLTSSLGELVNSPVETGISLAHDCGARLVICTVFNWSEDAMHQMDPEDPSQHSYEEEARLVLYDLVGRAARRGVQAEAKLVLGKPWREIVREAVLGEHDLLVIGPHDASGLHLFADNTAVKLMRTCPCPVWVAKSAAARLHPNILAATDLEPAGEAAMHLAVELGRQLDATVHVLHVAVNRIDEFGWSEEPDLDVQQHHQNVLAAAEESLLRQLESTSYLDLGERCQIHVAEDVGNPAHVIEQFIEANQIDLLVIGTAARDGLTGAIVGNSAERLMPDLPCSLLTVKAPDFHCPVTFESYQTVHG